MEIKNLTIGQKKALIISLENQVSKKTPSEVKLLNELREDLAEVEIFGGFAFLVCGSYAKQLEMDKFDEDYRNSWIKIKESGKGFFITSYYTGNKRLYNEF
jgi:hypothetical protein